MWFVGEVGVVLEGLEVEVLWLLASICSVQGRE